MRKCYYHYDKEVGKVLIHGCMGSAVHGPHRCTCRNEDPGSEKRMIIELKEKNKFLEEEVNKLQRIINRLNKSKNNNP